MTKFLTMVMPFLFCFIQFYAVCSDSDSTYDDCQHTEKKNAEDENAEDVWKVTFETVLYPALKKKLIPQNIQEEKEKLFVQVASLPELYKVFERC